ncbi:twin-arginine translocation signal domain-containing protein [Vibrio aquaticus]|uniref:Twin-arginine translocation signal domain-containing protein n=1 Tax=Vibrio aquaticus TaxID=2496559 RepID=A0A432D2I6_9VIBR|nr:twin-arginine translocation signal domain-containing protein [Vibrio aquaticus]RTZ18085.1 twin-arginine translocation signal domain-containing protein [Vibrio aquaticus]
MNRRNFIKVLGAGGVVLAASPIVIQQMKPAKTAQLRPTHTYDDIKKTLLSYAMLSANPHNIQPWKVAFPAQNQILLYVDSERLLPQTDPIHRQIHIGQGTFIEGLVIAASHFGIRVDVDYFPQGEYDNQSLEEKPVAALTLVPDDTVKADPLFQYLAIRQSTKTPYSSEILPTQQLVEVQKVNQQANFAIQFVEAQADSDTMANFLTEAMMVEEQKSARSLETISMFRFNEQEMSQYRDGFGFPQNGVTGPKRWLAETLLVSREKAENDPYSFGQEGVKAIRKAAENAPHFGLLISDSNSRLDQVKCGRTYQRINLVTASMGLTQHPMSQILQEYDDMLPLQAKFKQHYGVKSSQTVQMLFRLGKADLTPASPRREVSDIVVS